MRHSLDRTSRQIGACLVILAACGAASGQMGSTVARIGDQTISVQQFEAMAQELRQTGYAHIKELDQQSKRELLDGIIARQLLVIEGIRRGYDRDSTVAWAVDKAERKALMKKLYEQEAVQVSYSFTEEELRRFFVEQQYDIEVFSQHIVCESEEKARQVLAALERGAPFESLVNVYSIPSIQHRFGPTGWVGVFKIGEVFAELKEPLSTMAPGSVYPEPVKTAIGYHVFRLNARRPVDFAASRQWLEQQARIHSRARDMERYVEELRRRYQLVLHSQVFAALLKLPPETTVWTGEDQPLLSWRGGQLTARDYLDQVHRGSARHPAALDSAGLHRDADNLAGKQIMMAEARKLGLDQDADIRQTVEAERAKLLVKRLYRVEAGKRVRIIGDQEVRDFYDQHLDQFTRADGKVAEFSFVQESIRTLLRELAANQAMDAFLAELRQTYKGQIEIFPEALDLAFANGSSP